MSGPLLRPRPALPPLSQGIIDVHGAEAVQALFALFQAVADPSQDREALVATIRQSRKRLAAFASALGEPFTLSWTPPEPDGGGSRCLVSGRLLKADGRAWSRARAIGEVFSSANVGAVTISEAAREQALVALAQAFLAARSQGPAGLMALEHLSQPGLTLHTRAAEAPPPRQTAMDTLQQVFTRAAMEVKAHHRALDEGHAGRSPSLTHAAHLVAGQCTRPLSHRPHIALAGLVPLRAPSPVRAAQVAVLMGTLAAQLNRSRAALAPLVELALLSESWGHLRGEEAPGFAAGIMLSAEGLTELGVWWAQNASEAVESARGEGHGPHYTGGLPGRMLHLCRAFVQGLYDDNVPEEDRTSAAILRRLSRAPDVNPDLLKLLIRTVGIIPLGSPVLLESGAWAVVSALSSQPNSLQRPQIRVLTTPDGKPLLRPRDIDLGAHGTNASAQGMFIVRPLHPNEARFNPLSALA